MLIGGRLERLTLSSSRRVVTSMALGVLALGVAVGAWAGPDNCVTQAGAAVCEGN